MKELAIDGFFAWSSYDTELKMDRNSYLWVRPGGNLVFDPIAMSPDDLAHAKALGGARWCVLTHAEHLREAPALQKELKFGVVAHEADAQKLGLAVERRLHDAESIVDGLVVMDMPFGKTLGEMVLLLEERATVIVGDVLWGAPAGTLRFPPDNMMLAPEKAVALVRQLLAQPIQNVLPGHGAPIFRNARAALNDCVAERQGFAFNRLNLEDIPWRSRDAAPQYHHQIKDVSRLIGAEQLGYNVRRIPPGASTGGRHFHDLAEELFFVLDGQCTVLRDHGELDLTKGDFLCCPTGWTGVHKLVNRGTQDCVVLCVSNLIDRDRRVEVGDPELRQDLFVP